jgi:SAM-dependent methyltransferase
MAKNSNAKDFNSQGLSGFLGDRPPEWQAQLDAVTQRYNQEYRGEAFDLPAEVEAMPIFREWASHQLAARIASPFWAIAKPKKNSRCLDLGCGVSFLIYPWREWEAYFYGQDISGVARDTLNARGSQLNSKLFKGVVLGGAHQLPYEAQQFDQVIATGWSCYYPLAYWAQVLSEVKRVLKPGGIFVFDVLDPETELAENWAILETYLGSEVFLEPLADWQATLTAAGGKVRKTQEGELFQLYRAVFE